ncbi:MAG: hypothetical protein QE494_00635 [Ramlibacter sp.]|uniref:hypothetical protein n=1 Tax=Ramlibacter sp. TaxID=1917967 RepID=UPI002609912E|nr:hypothetical protein [Ramlibacter sp.]MDH4374784.1 hypothetical protein [Ramlibacter sp.]
MNFLELRLPGWGLVARVLESVPTPGHRLSQRSTRFGRAGWMKFQQTGSLGELYLFAKSELVIPLKVMVIQHINGKLRHYLSKSV